MTLLERWDAHPPHFSQLCDVNEDEIRRAIAITEVVQKHADNQAMRRSHIIAIEFLDEAEELLAEKEKTT